MKYGHGDDHARPNMSVSLEEWIAQAPTVSSSWNELERISQRSIVDLAALRYFPPILPGKAVPAAGLPWFMTLFGRDSLTTSYMAMPFEPELAETTLFSSPPGRARRSTSSVTRSRGRSSTSSASASSRPSRSARTRPISGAPTRPNSG